MKKLSMILAVFLSPYGLSAQTATQNTGIPPFSSLSSSGFDSVNNQNLNAYFTIPMVSSPGRGIPLNLTLSYNTLVWQPVNSGGTTTWTSVTDLSGNPTWGWAKDIPGGQSSYRARTVTIKCFPPGGAPWFFTTHTTYDNYLYTDVLGTVHGFPLSIIDDGNCSGNIIGATTAYASDHSGYYMDASSLTSPLVTSPTGLKSPNGTATTPNGANVTKIIVSSTETDWKDSLQKSTIK